MNDYRHLRALIVDDSPQARKLLRLLLLENHEDVEICGEAEDVDGAVALIRSEKPDLVFLDIEMPGKSGLKLVEEISRNEVRYEIIFTTAYNDYALKAFRLSAIDYLLKPIHEEQLEEALAKAREKQALQQADMRLQTLMHNLNPGNDRMLSIPVQTGFEYLSLDEVEFLEADGSYVHLHLVNGKVKTVSKNLKHFENTLEAIPYFFRPHRSFLANLNHMVSFSKSDRGQIIMRSGKVIQVARNRREEFQKALDHL